MNNFSALYINWEEDQQQAFARYCNWLRWTGRTAIDAVDKEPSVNVSGRTVSRFLLGHGIGPKGIKNLDAIFEFLKLNVKDDDFLEFDTWYAKHGHLTHKEIEAAAAEAESAEPDDTTNYQEHVIALPRFWYLYLAGALIVGVIFEHFYSSWADERYLNEMVERDEKIQAEFDAAEAEARKPPVIDWSNVKLKFRVWSDYKQISIAVADTKGLPTASIIAVSRDGETFDNDNMIKGILPSDGFYVRLTSYDWDGASDSHNFGSLAHNAIQEHLSSSEKYSLIECQPGACKINESRYCTGDWSEVTFGRSPQSKDVVANLKTCTQKANPKPICLSMPTSFFPTKPGDKVHVTLKDKKGGLYKLPVEIPEWKYSTWLPLEPITDPSITPYAVAALEPRRHKSKKDFRVIFGAGGCAVDAFLSMEETINGIYYDIDGLGDVASGPERLGYFAVPPSKNGKLKVTLTAGEYDSKPYGPYEYKFNSEDIVANNIEGLTKPKKLACRPLFVHRKTASYACFVKLKGFGLAAWSKAEKLTFGKTGDNMDNTFHFDIDMEDVLDNLKNEDPRRNPDLKIIEVDASWTDVFYQVFYKDGTKSIIEKIKLPDPL